MTDTLDLTSWRRFVDRQPGGNIFHTPEMFQVFKRACNHQPHVRAVVDEGGQIQALMLPVLVTLINGPFSRLTTRAIAFGGVLCSYEATGIEALKLLLSPHSKDPCRKALFTELRHLSDTQAIQAVLVQNGFVCEEHLNFLIDLNKPAQDVFQNIGARTRKHLRQALRKGAVTIEVMETIDLLPRWYELVHKSYTNAQVPLADRSLFEAAFDLLRPLGMVQFWLARLGNTYVAASVELLYKDVIYGWYSGVDRDFTDESPGELLMWRVLEWGAENGYRQYDFGGAGKPGEAYGVRDFKAKFGGKLVCFGRNTKIHAPGLLRLSQAGYHLYRRSIGISSYLHNGIIQPAR